MKKIIIITMIIICIVINVGCKEQKLKDVITNKTPEITNEEIMSILEKASEKVGYVFHLGEGIEGCKVNKEPIKIKGEEEGDYYELGSSINTFVKLNIFLKNEFTEKCIENLVRGLYIEEFKGKLFMSSCDIVSGAYWTEGKVLAVKYDKNKAFVKLKVEAVIDGEYGEETLEFEYNKKYGWRLNIKHPIYLY